MDEEPRAELMFASSSVHEQWKHSPMIGLYGFRAVDPCNH